MSQDSWCLTTDIKAKQIAPPLCSRFQILIGNNSLILKEGHIHTFKYIFVSVWGLFDFWYRVKPGNKGRPIAELFHFAFLGVSLPLPGWSLHGPYCSPCLDHIPIHLLWNSVQNHNIAVAKQSALWSAKIVLTVPSFSLEYRESVIFCLTDNKCWVAPTTTIALSAVQDGPYYQDLPTTAPPCTE